jgi:hypothetical protein
MADVGYHFANLWFAADKQNWPLANYYLGETRSHLRWAVRLHPVQQTKAGEVDLKGILDAVDNSFLTRLVQALRTKILRNSKLRIAKPSRAVTPATRPAKSLSFAHRSRAGPAYRSSISIPPLRGQNESAAPQGNHLATIMQNREEQVGSGKNI